MNDLRTIYVKRPTEVDEVADSPPRECACPEWVERCVHYEGLGLYLVDPNVYVTGRCWACAALPSGYFVGAYIGERSECPGCGLPGFLEGQQRLYIGGLTDHDAALAAFYAAEARLLGRAE